MNSNETRRRRFPGLVLILGVMTLALPFYQQILGNVAYALEKGKLEASEEHLAQVEKLEAISHAFRMVARQVKPAVVHITTIATPEENGDGEADAEELRELFRRFGLPEGFELPDGFEMPDARPRESSGSGVIVDAENGFIVTNNHVVSDAADEQGRIDVRLADGRQVRGNVVGLDEKTDLAVIKIDADRLHELPLGDSDKMDVGDWVLAIGAPFGLTQTVTQGIVSAKGRSQILRIGYEDLIQTDAAINPGNSGGPLVNMRGEIIGINVAIATNGLLRGYMGVGFAIPSATVKEILPALKEGKRVVRGYLGVSIQSLSVQGPGFAKTFGLDHDNGVLIQEVFPNTPASKAGLQREDIILEYDGEPVEEATELTELVARTKPDTEVDLLVWREREKITIPVTIEKQPQDFFTWRGERGRGGSEFSRRDDEPLELESIGMTVQPLTSKLAEEYGWEGKEDVEDALVVTEVDPLGEARAIGIRPGHLVISVQGESMKTTSQLKRALDAEALAEGVRLGTRTRSGYRSLYLQVSP